MFYKITKRFNLLNLVLLIFLLQCEFPVSAQESFENPLHITRKCKDYKKQVGNNSDKKMVELKNLIPDIRYDLRYASKNNFTKKTFYPRDTKTTFLRKPAAYALLKVEEDFKPKGLGLKIFDAYRPYSATVKFWELVKDERYVANPSKGSNHNRGIAVDLTIISLSNGKELDMGTGFDNFSDTAHHTFKFLSGEALFNRALLKNIMEKNGFKSYENEWWHYTWQDTISYEVLDVPVKKLEKCL